MASDDEEGVLSSLLAASHLAAPDDVAGLVVDHARRLGAADAAIYLVDYEQLVLVPVPTPTGPQREPVSIDSTLAGRCFRMLDAQETQANCEGRRLWVPLVDGVERVGVLEVVFAGDDESRGERGEQVRRLASLVAKLIVTKTPYGDLFERLRRRQAMSLAAEIAWQLLPPLTFGTDQLVITAVVTPAYEVGGDCFDYAVGEGRAWFAVFDGMGHGLEAGLLATVAVAAFRNGRRRGLDLLTTAAGIDSAISTHFGPERFVTAVLGELDLSSGSLRWTLAGHPAPLLLRNGKVIKALSAPLGAPLGLGLPVTVAEERLEPGDQLLLFSDGVVDARSEEGDFFGVERLGDLVTREWSAGHPPPETMRRLVQAVLGHQAGELQDDATTVLVEWLGSGPDGIVDTRGR